MTRLAPLLLVACFAFAVRAAEFDVVVYGGTPAGVAAAVAAAREGGGHLKVGLVVPPPHRIGGMCSGGLGATDKGNTSVIGGFSFEFFEANGRAYGRNLTWNLEPHVALEIFQKFLSEAGVSVQYTDNVASVARVGTRISAFTTVDKLTFAGKVFIDSSYEGDLVARSNISYTYGRESRQQYNEPLAGNLGRAEGHQFAVAVNPFGPDGKPLPFVTAGPPGTPGEADQKIEAYNFRLCVTQNKTNLVPFPKPADYDPAQWELARRWYIATVAAGGKPPNAPSCNVQQVPGDKADMNNCGPVSSDVIGPYAWEYPEASYERRQQLWQLHQSYTQGLLWFMGHDPSVPENIRNETLSWGLCKDEFVESNNWPAQLYVREARRMVGDEVFTQVVINNNRGKDIGVDSIGMGSYNYDSHNAQRYACTDPSVCKKFPVPYVWNEGDLEENPGYRYQIPITVLFPKRAQATNLLSPTAPSASHVAFATLRMEPQFMIVGQSAGTVAAVALANSGQVNVQDVDRTEVHRRLLAAKQILSLD
eukprot:TRINITY_DN3698_c0_g1_i1.p1 TRINITY_DN3698_c0_g1~~TRINITY_DN3698_c0_g1_i1.p1  ORF type:complete len:541 (+),score=81.78 TRINITY_DN3698_c0_g1_i1:22-1623(+)